MNMYTLNAMLLTATGAGQDLFSEDWTQGNLYKIQDVVQVLGNVAVTVISFVGFGIVIFSILKNAFSGLYVVNPAFWDKVDEVKQTAVNGISGTINDAAGRVPGGGNAVATKLGGLFTFLLGLIPNVKALTDFEDGEEIDKKQYFMKSLPLLVAQIFIGMFIFFGYPSRIAEWIGNGASYALNAVLENNDPVTIITGFSQSFVSVKLMTDGSQMPIEQTINDATRKAVAPISTKYDVKAQPLQQVATEIESWLLQELQGTSTIEDVLGASDGYNVSITCGIQESQPTASAAFAQISGTNVYMAQATNGAVSYRLWKNINEFSTGAATVGSDDYLTVTIQAVPVSVSSVATADMVVFGQFDTAGVVAGNSWTVPISIQNGSELGNVKGTPGRSVTVTVMDGTGNALATFNPTIQTTDMTSSTSMLTLVFSKADKERMANVSGTWVVGLSGSWSVSATKNNTTVTYPVKELRLVSGSGRSANMTYMLTTDPGFSDTITSGSTLETAVSSGASNQ